MSHRASRGATGRGYTPTPDPLTGSSALRSTPSSAGLYTSSMRARLAILLILFLALIAAINHNGPLAEDSVQVAFPVPDALAPAVRFWTRVYTEVDSASGFIHDNRNLDVVYGILYLNPAAPPQAQNLAIDKVLGEYRRALLALASGGHDAGTSIEKRAGRAWGQEAGAAEPRRQRSACGSNEASRIVFSTAWTGMPAGKRRSRRFSAARACPSSWPRCPWWSRPTIRARYPRPARWACGSSCPRRRGDTCVWIKGSMNG